MVSPLAFFSQANSIAMDAAKPWLERKYNNMDAQTGIQQQTANTEAMRAQAAAELDLARASEAPANIAETQSRAGLNRAQTGLVGSQTQDQNLKNRAGAAYIPILNEFTGAGGAPSTSLSSPVFRLSAPGSLGSSLESDERRRRGLRMGTEEVMVKGKTKVKDKKGKGSPTVDTVPAVLAEGEAVLNAGAAEIMGRDEIRELNKKGLRDMGLSAHSKPVIKKGGRIGAYSGVTLKPVMSDEPRVYAVSGAEMIESLRRKTGQAFSAARDFVRPTATAAAPQPAPAAAAAPQMTAAQVAEQARMAKQAQAAQSARMAIGEGARMASNSATSGAAQAATNTASQAAPKSMAFQAGQLSGKAAKGAIDKAGGRLPLAAAGLSAYTGLQEAVEAAPKEFYDDPNVPTTEKAKQALRAVYRHGLPFVTGTIGAGAGAGLASVATGGAGYLLGKGLAEGTVDAEGDAVKQWKAQQGQKAAQLPPRTMTMSTEKQQSLRNQQAQALPQDRLSDEYLRKLAIITAGMRGDDTSAVLSDIRERRVGTGKAAPNVKAPEFFEFSSEPGKPGQKRDDLKANFESQYLPEFAASVGRRPEELTPADVSDAFDSFQLNRAAQAYAATSNNAFRLRKPLIPEQTEFMSDIPAMRRIFGKRRGQAGFSEGILDDGAIIITDGEVRQEVPISFLKQSGAMNEPSIFRAVQAAMQRDAQLKSQGLR
jgi:hypothetical protein